MTQEQSDQRDAQGTGRVGHKTSTCLPVHVHHPPQISTCSPSYKLSEIHPLVSLIRFYYIHIIGYIIGHWWLVQIPASFPPCRERAENENSNPLIHLFGVLFFFLSVFVFILFTLVKYSFSDFYA